MNIFEFAVKAGFPFTESTVEFMQGMMLQIQYGSLLGGSNYILSGCTENNNVIDGGWVVVNGEVLPFVGGAKQTYVIIAETRTKKQFFGGAMNDYYIERKATFGTIAGAQYEWSSFRRNDPANGVLARLDKVEKMLKPLMPYSAGGNTVYGSWLFWGRPASEIPDGWEAVPDADWKGRIPVVMDPADTDFDTVGEVQGSKSFNIQQTNLPHIQLGISGAKGTGGIDNNPSGGGYGYGSDKQAPSTPLKTDFIGDGTAVKFIPKVKVVLFIRWKNQ